jgi:hypothetical protein
MPFASPHGSPRRTLACSCAGGQSRFSCRNNTRIVDGESKIEEGNPPLSAPKNPCEKILEFAWHSGSGGYFPGT